MQLSLHRTHQHPEKLSALEYGEILPVGAHRLLNKITRYNLDS